MNIKKCVLVEKYKGYEIFVDKDTSRFWLVNKKRGVEEECSGIWDAKQCVNQSLTTDVDNVQAIITSGFLDIALSRVDVLSKYTNNRYRYKITESTEKYGDVGKTETDKVVLYPLSPDNIKIYDELVRLEKEKDKLIRKQESLVATFKTGKKLKI